MIIDRVFKVFTIIKTALKHIKMLLFLNVEIQKLNNFLRGLKPSIPKLWRVTFWKSVEANH